MDSLLSDFKNLKINNEDVYTRLILTERYILYRTSYSKTVEIINRTNLPIRHQNPPEDITENIVKFIINNYENDMTCRWAKSLGLNGDLYSEKYDKKYQPEVKAFTSNGPLSFGPKKTFGALYFLDMRNWLLDVFVLWKVNITNESKKWKNLKMNKSQTQEEQCKEKRRPHISWDKIYEQLPEKCSKIYEGTFDNIFMNKSTQSNDSQLVQQQEQKQNCQTVYKD
jgi:hypothetical protein